MYIGVLYYHRNMKHIVKGREVIIDDEDEPIFQQYNWHISDSGYVVWRGIKDGRKQTIRLHRLIARPPEGLIVDHINRNKLDNRRSNLRCTTPAVNCMNQDKVENAKGYYLSKSKISNVGKWVVDFHGVCNTFLTEDEARAAVEQIKNGTFVKAKDLLHEKCRKCGSLKQFYGGAWLCRKCALQRMKEYYKRKKERLLNEQTKKG